MMGGDACKLGFFVVPDGADNGIESEGFIDVSEFDLDAQLLGEAAFELGLPVHAQVTPMGMEPPYSNGMITLTFQLTMMTSTT